VTFTLDPLKPFENFCNSLMAPPNYSGFEFRILEDFGRTLKAFSAASVVDLDQANARRRTKSRRPYRYCNKGFGTLATRAQAPTGATYGQSQRHLVGPSAHGGGPTIALDSSAAQRYSELEGSQRLAA
jgi:hypothetical protein